MRPARPPGFWPARRRSARAELRELARQPGLYLFVPLILLQMFGTALDRASAPSTRRCSRRRACSATGAMNTLTLLICLLILFYTVESLRARARARPRADLLRDAGAHRLDALRQGAREQRSSASSIARRRVRWAAVIVLLVQGKVPLDLGPFVAASGGCCSLPTFLVWTAFVTAALRGRGQPLRDLRARPRRAGPDRLVPDARAR